MLDFPTFTFSCIQFSALIPSSLLLFQARSYTNPRFTALSHFPPSLRHSGTLWYTHTFPLNTDLSPYPSLSHRYIITHRTLLLLCTLFVPFPHSFATLSLLHGHRHILFPTRLHRLLQLGHTRSYIVAHSHARFVTHTQSLAPLLLPLPTLPRRPAAAPMTSRRARGAARRGRRLAGRASAVLQSRRGSYNCGGMGGTDHCIAHL